MSKQDNYIDQENLTGRQVFVSKLRDKPEATLGLLSFAAVVAYGLYGIKKRKVNTGLYVVQFRVYAQTAALGCMGIGLIYQMYKQYIKSPEKTD